RHFHQFLLAASSYSRLRGPYQFREFILAATWASSVPRVHTRGYGVGLGMIRALNVCLAVPICTVSGADIPEAGTVSFTRRSFFNSASHSAPLSVASNSIMPP